MSIQINQCSRKEYQKKWRETHKEQIKKYEEEHKEQKKERDKKYCETHKQQRNELSKKYHKLNRKSSLTRIGYIVNCPKCSKSGIIYEEKEYNKKTNQTYKPRIIITHTNPKIICHVKEVEGVITN